MTSSIKREYTTYRNAQRDAHIADMHKLFGEDQTCGSGDMLADTTHVRSKPNTLVTIFRFHIGGGVMTKIDRACNCNSDSNFFCICTRCNCLSCKLCNMFIAVLLCSQFSRLTVRTLPGISVTSYFSSNMTKMTNM